MHWEGHRVAQTDCRGASCGADGQRRAAQPLKELVLIKLSTYAKIGVIERLPYRRQPRSLRHLPTLKDIVQARNFLAHTHRLQAVHLPARVDPWVYLLADYPAAYNVHLQSVRRMLRSLLRTRDIAGPMAPTWMPSAAGPA
jgi:hypothetical protein